jgi:hypothetical protein
MTPPGSGFFFLTLPPELLAVASGQADGAFPKLGPGGMSTTGLLDAIGRHIQPAAATLLGPGDIEVGAVAAIRVAMTSAVRVAATAGGPGQPALDHNPGGAKELGEERFLPNHIVILGNRESSVKKKSAFGHGIYSRKCENRGSERFILRRKVASFRGETAILKICG